MEGRMRPYLPELTIRDYNTYLWYLRGVRWQMSRSYGFYSCRLLQHNGVLFALLADSLAGRPATCVNQRLPGTLCYRQMMCQTQGIRLAAQVEVMMGWHKLQDRRWDELPLRSQLFRAVDHALLRRAYEKAVNENPALERLFGQEQAQAVVQMNLNAKNYSVAAEPMSNIYGALYSTLATDDPSQRKSMRYIGSCIGRVCPYHSGHTPWAFHCREPITFRRDASPRFTGRPPFSSPYFPLYKGIFPQAPFSPKQD